MLSKNFLKTIRIPNNKILQFSSILKLSTSCANFNYYYQKDSLPRTERRLKKWVDDPVEKDYGWLSSKESIFRFLQVEIEVTPTGIKKFFKQKMTNWKIKDQKFNSERNKILGADLSSAYFILGNQGKVKFKRQNEWISMKNQNNENLPSSFDQNFIVEGVDLSDVPLYYEGLENFENIPRVKTAIFTRSPFLDDWYLDKISGLFPELEYLDVSECSGVTERGLEALYRTSWLKKLIITNYRKTAAFELTCMMLEDVLPGLKIDIREPKNES